MNKKTEDVVNVSNGIQLATNDNQNDKLLLISQKASISMSQQLRYHF